MRETVSSPRFAIRHNPDTERDGSRVVADGEGLETRSEGGVDTDDLVVGIVGHPHVPTTDDNVVGAPGQWYGANHLSP